MITSHKNPDGDALGASLGWTKFLSRKGHSVDYISPNAMPDFFQWLPGAAGMIIFDRNRDYAKALLQAADIIFCLDYNTLSRVEDLGELIRQSAAKKVLVDHHLQPEAFADLTFSRITASSTGELIFDLMEGLEEVDKIDQATAELLYTAILTDTGSFAFSCTTARVHRIIATLVEKGADPDRIHNLVYNCFTESRLRFLGYCITQKMVIIPGTDIAYIGVTQREMREYDIREGETEGVVNFPLKMEKIKAVAFFKENEKQVKISFRSKGDFDVNALAREHFSGGGHKNAAGGIAYDGLEKTIDKFVQIFQPNKEKSE